MKTYFKNILLILILILVLPNYIFAIENKAIRVSGSNRILTAIEISKEVYEKSDTAILIEYHSHLDALLSTILSKKEDAPILITTKDKLSPAVKDEIKRLGAKNIILVGENNKFSDKLKEELSDLNIHQISGKDIEELSINMINDVYSGEVPQVFLTLGYGVFADALSIGSVSADKDIPILLSYSEYISDTTINALKYLNVKKVTIIGGKLAINATVEDQLSSIGIEFERISGSNREDTAIKISERYNPNLENVIVANGYNYADAVTGGYFAFKNNASIVLTRDNNMVLPALEHLKKTQDNIYIFGGEKAVDKVIEKDINYILNSYQIREKEKDTIIPFKTIIQEDNTLEKGSTKVKIEGIDGSGIALERIIIDKQDEIDRRIIRITVLIKPTDKIIVQGTKESVLSKNDLYFITQNLDLRKNPSADSKIIATIAKGTHLDYISSHGDYHQVIYEGKTGYLLAKSVKKGTGYTIDGTLIVNKGYALSSNFNPGINPQAWTSLNKMIADAKKDKITLNVFSDFRSYGYQVNLHNRYVKKDGQKIAETYSARAGYSEHQTGLAFDIGGTDSKYYLSQKLGQMKEGIWMSKNASSYGFILRYPKGKEKITGFSYEPWHFRYVGVDLAKKIEISGLTLEEYYHAIKPDY